MLVIMAIFIAAFGLIFSFVISFPLTKWLERKWQEYNERKQN